MGGNYITWFNQEGSERRSLLYKLENMNIVRLTSEFSKREGNMRAYTHNWILTNKGQELIDTNKCLQELWGDGKKVDVVAFYNKVMEILKQMEED
jgi:hypothetical protein